MKYKYKSLWEDIIDVENLIIEGNNKNKNKSKDRDIKKKNLQVKSFCKRYY